MFPVNHLNSKTFKKRYLPVDETENDEATSQVSTEDEGIDVNDEGNPADASELEASGKTEEGAGADNDPKGDSGDTEESKGEVNDDLMDTASECVAGDIQVESLPSGNVIGSPSQDEEGTSEHRLALPPRGDSGIDVTSPGEEGSAKLDVDQATVRRDGPIHRGEPTIFWSASEDSKYDFEFFTGPDYEELRKLAVFVDPSDNHKSVKGIRFKRDDLGWGRYLGTGEGEEANVAVFELQGESIESSCFQRRDTEDGGLVALSVRSLFSTLLVLSWI